MITIKKYRIGSLPHAFPVLFIPILSLWILSGLFGIFTDRLPIRVQNTITVLSAMVYLICGIVVACSSWLSMWRNHHIIKWARSSHNCFPIGEHQQISSIVEQNDDKHGKLLIIINDDEKVTFLYLPKEQDRVLYRLAM